MVYLCTAYQVGAVKSSGEARKIRIPISVFYGEQLLKTMANAECLPNMVNLICKAIAFTCTDELPKYQYLL